VGGGVDLAGRVRYIISNSRCPKRDRGSKGYDAFSISGEEGLSRNTIHRLVAMDWVEKGGGGKWVELHRIGVDRAPQTFLR